MSITPYALGRTPGNYPLNANYPMRALMDVLPPRARRSPWAGGPLLDQGAVGQCVGATGREWLTSSPVLYKAPHPTMEESYFGAKQFDGFGDPTPDRGSNSNGLMKFYQSIGLVDSYYWTDNAEQAAEYVLTRGCVLLGTPWDNSMFYPDATGQVHPDGNEVGGHEITIEWFYKTKKLFLIRNHWRNQDGSWWGNVKSHPGYFTISLADLDGLVGRGADLCAAVEHPL
jgi:hypothetical protein